jgi:hypothetical protein
MVYFRCGDMGERFQQSQRVQLVSTLPVHLLYRSSAGAPAHDLAVRLKLRPFFMSQTLADAS